MTDTQIKEIQEKAVDELQKCQELARLEEWRVKYFAKKGLLNLMFKEMIYQAKDKKLFGQDFNAMKQQLETDLSDKEAELKQERLENEFFDVTAPGVDPKVGHVHPMTQAIEEISQIFTEIGFVRVRYPEVDWDWYVFEGLNFPAGHPARDTQETFWVDAAASEKYGPMVMTTHTSNGQVREMERLKGQPPMRMINIGKCYRRQQDLTHTHMFHQFEGMVIDEGITIQHLKGTIDYFCQRFYGPESKSRLRPHNFRFTEPSFEVDFSCTICKGTSKLADGSSCRMCKSGWLEIGGAGMIHPNVLKAGGVDPEKYTGFAFGWGVERAYTIKPGLKVDDIRLFYQTNLEFLEQF